jgi:hypothetical protein
MTELLHTHTSAHIAMSMSTRCPLEETTVYRHILNAKEIQLWKIWSVALVPTWDEVKRKPIGGPSDWKLSGLMICTSCMHLAMLIGPGWVCLQDSGQSLAVHWPLHVGPRLRMPAEGVLLLLLPEVVEDVPWKFVLLLEAQAMQLQDGSVAQSQNQSGAN